MQDNVMRGVFAPHSYFIASGDLNLVKGCSFIGRLKVA